MRIGLFGGSFDPPHVGHVLVAAWALSVPRPRVDRLLVAPTFAHYFGKRLAPFEDRLEMVRQAMAPFGDRVEVSDIERRLGGISRTFATVEAIRAERPQARVAVVIGADLLAERERWHRWDELATMADFLVVGRAGHDGGEGVAIPDVSSTEVRRRLATGRAVDGLVPADVADYATAHGLYLGAPGDPV